MIKTGVKENAEVLTERSLLMEEYREVMITDGCSLQVSLNRKMYHVIFVLKIGFYEDLHTFLESFGWLIRERWKKILGRSCLHCILESNLELTEWEKTYFELRYFDLQRILRLQRIYWEEDGS